VTTIDAAVISRFKQHGLPALIAKHCGAVFPWELACAIVEIECAGDPGAFNYYDASGKMHRGSWVDGTPLPDGADGRPNAWAAGVCQIIGKYPRGLSLAERFDADKSLGVVVPEWKVFYARARLAGLHGFDLNAATYLGQNQGGGALGKGLQNAHGGICAVVNGACSDSNAPAVLAVCRKVASHAAMWATLKSSLLGAP
jgi:hypothetical protein